MLNLMKSANSLKSLLLKSLCLLIVSLTLTGCNPSIKQSTLQISPLDESLAKPCDQLSSPDGDYDKWQVWIMEEVLPAYTACGIDKNKIVQEWNKLVEKNKQLRQTK